MNILPKKRWHVRTKDNIARVRRDEAKAADEEKQKQNRIQLAEQEARTDFLRQRAKERDEDHLPNTYFASTSQRPDIQQDHVNFFSKIEEDGGYKGGSNPEYEKEKKEEQITYEKKIGLLTYLGQNSSESLKETPWYLKSHELRNTKQDSNQEEESKSLKRKALQDPLADIRGYLHKKSKTSDSTTSKNKKHHKKDKSHKQEKTSKKKSLEELRAERVKRERAEKEKARLLLAKVRGELPKEPEISQDERKHKYNSQYHPHLAR